MEHYEKVVIESAPLKPIAGFHYVDDTFDTWPHGPDKLKDLLHHLTNTHKSIHFT
jgi:hypothetical protein